ncbi:MAG: lipoate--protein ligase family protein [Deltaproteobacteria bacterium]|nr:lipoate--protein ligase family protein [Deltaproteobacteria bacterium]
MAWRLLDFQNNNIFENMAIDEAVFRETIKNKKHPTIRFYGSRPAAVSIGYFQDAEKEVNIEKCCREGIDIVRRITGGKAVFHFKEITYCVAAGEREKIFPADISGTYEVISRCIARGLSALGIKADLAEGGRAQTGEEINSCCFSVPSKNELLVNGRKICGSAQVRGKGGFLQHGSLLMDFDPLKMAALLLPDRSPEQVENLGKFVTAINEESASPVDIRDICLQLKKGFIEEMGIELEEETLTPAEETLKNELIKKYTDANWNIERKKYFKRIDY